MTRTPLGTAAWVVHTAIEVGARVVGRLRWWR